MSTSQNENENQDNLDMDAISPRHTTNAHDEEEEKKEYAEIEAVESFDDMNLRPEIYRGILSYGFERPSVIQQKAIPAFIKYNRDIIAQAQSGTGKTATFSVALLQKINEEDDYLQGIILAPTRELATQIHTVITSIGQFTKVRIALVSGGGNVRDCINHLHRDRPHVIVATPGRICHLLRDRHINIRHLSYFIMDEADQMLSTDFQSQIRDIVEQLPNSDDQQTQIGLYSATMSSEIYTVARRFMNNPIEIRVAREMLTLEGIRQYVVQLENERFKFATLMDLYSSISIYQMMIYCNSKRSVEYLSRELQYEKVPCEAIHGQMTTADRNDVMKRFRSGDLRVLITTDLLCRGIDVQQVSLVINYDFPREVESYLHRIGRGGRFGRKGYAINFVVQSSNDYDRRGGGGRRGREANDVQNFRTVVEYYETQIDPLPEDLKVALS